MLKDLADGFQVWPPVRNFPTSVCLSGEASDSTSASENSTAGSPQYGESALIEQEEGVVWFCSTVAKKWPPCTRVAWAARVASGARASSV